MLSMEEFKPNSHKYREEKNSPSVEKKKIKKVISGEVSTKKRPAGKRIAESLISEDISNIKSYVIFDVLIPAIKDTFVDTLITGIEMLFGGESSTRRRHHKSSSNEVTSYTKYYKQDSKNNRTSTRSDRPYNYNEVIFHNRGEAEEVLDCLCGLVDEYGTASVADLYDLVGIPTNWTDNSYGWYDLKTARVEKISRDEWILNLPRTTALN